VVARLHAAADLDAALVVLRKVRSQTEEVGCVQTDRKGEAVAAWDVERGAVYLVAVGQRKGSSPGDFSLRALAAQPREAAPGQHLARGSVRSRVDWLTDVNDDWWTTLVPGTTYRIAFSSEGCAALTIRGKGDVLRSFRCGGYTTFTPGPDAGGEVTKTMISASSAQVSPGSSVTFTIAIAPPPDGGVVKVEIDRFDTLAGWHFHHTVRLSAGAGFSWTPPAPGRWRARASYLGTIRFSPSNSGFATVLDAPPVGGR
jgi:hypothetical protein